MILEGLITTTNADGTVNLSPMGPVVERDFDRLLLRPYQTSTTYQNLLRRGEGVFHVTDDAELLAQAAIKQLDAVPPCDPCPAVDGWILRDACRWFAFRVRSIDDRLSRTEIVVDVVDRGHLREFFGFNRGKHAVVEAAILATRAEWLDPTLLRDELRRLQPAVDKTGGAAERRAMQRLREFIDGVLARREATADPAPIMEVAS